MNPSLNLLAVLNLLGAVQGLLMTLALLSVKRGNRLANRILAALTFTISIIVSGAVLQTTGYGFVLPHLSRVHHPFAFLAGPLLFLYLRALTSGSQDFKKKDLLHFIPFALCTLYLIPYYFQSGEGKLKYLMAEYYQDSLGRWYYIRSAFFLLQFLVYLIVIVAMLIKYSRRANRSSPYDRYVLLQVRFFMIASVILWLGAVLRYALDQSARTNLLIPLGASVLIYAMGYLRLSRPQVMLNVENNLPAKKYERSTLLPERAERYLDRLLQVMKTEKPFTDGDLTLQILARKLSIPANHLSQLVNEQFGQTFSDFINAYRVEEAKKRLLDPKLKHYTVQAIAEDVGFNTKSSFNAVFKKLTSMTPSEFRKASDDNGAR
jgi:AraC-like DNA-binding protein